MPQAVTVALGAATRAGELLDPICRLYDEVFSASPFLWTDEESAHHREMLTSLLREPSFGIALAEEGNTLVGFAYGYTLPERTRWWQNFQEPLSETLTDEWKGRTFALIDLAVRESWRRQGMGRRLVECLISSRSEDRATLTVQPTAKDAHTFYDTLGWRKVGRKEMPPGAVSPLFDVYVVELRANP